MASCAAAHHGLQSLPGRYVGWAERAKKTYFTVTADNSSFCTLSVIIPVYNAAGTLRDCLDAVFSSEYPAFECILVDDGSTDTSLNIARSYPARIIELPGGPHGPGQARNTGASLAQGEFLFFVDSDVVIRPDSLAKIVANFEQHPYYAALFGSYDEQPADGGLLSQYKNLSHHFVHQQANPEAGTFWSGCGAIRRDVFLQMGGFDTQRYPRPSIEDIELGRRLKKANQRILLDHSLQVKHFKKWTVSGWLRTDIRDRAIPWTRLILEENYLPDDLNVSSRQRWSALLAVGLLVASLAACLYSNPLLLALLGVLYLLVVPAWHWQEKRFLYKPSASQALASLAGASIYLLLAIVTDERLSAAGMIALGGSLLLAALLTRLRVAGQNLLFALTITFFSLASLALLYEVPLWLLALTLILAGLLLGLNLAFFRFFHRQRGLFFAIAVYPLQVVYYLYSLAAFVIAGGMQLFSGRSKTRPASSTHSTQGR